MQIDQRVKQAFNNEHKGVLLEYSLAQEFAKHSSGGLKNVTDDFMEQLKSYQNKLISDDVKTYSSLIKIAKRLCIFYLKKNPNPLLYIELAEKEHISSWGEADIKLNFEDEEKYISLKLIRSSSFVHTKSSGVHSLLSRYFDEPELQTAYSDRVRLNYSRFKTSFLNKYDLIEGSETFKGHLNLLGLADRPGKMNAEDKNLLYNFYKDCIDDLHEVLSELYQNKTRKFFQGLKALCGFSIDLEKLIFEYSDSKEMLDNHQILCEKWEEYGIEKKEDIQFQKSSSGNSSFIISSSVVDIQLRLKPMNSFVSGGFKINVSVRRKN